MNKYLVLIGQDRGSDKQVNWRFEHADDSPTKKEADLRAQKFQARSPSKQYFVAQLISKVETPLPPIKPL